MLLDRLFRKRNKKEEESLFIQKVKEGIKVGNDLLCDISQKYIFESRLLFDCVAFEVILQSIIAKDTTKMSSELRKLHIQLIEATRQKKNRWLGQIVNQDCRKKVEFAIDKLYGIASECVLLFLESKQSKSVDFQLNKNFLSSHKDPDGNTLIYTVNELLKFPGIEETIKSEDESDGQKSRKWFDTGLKKAFECELFRMKERFSDEEMSMIYGCIKGLTIWLWMTKVCKINSDLDKEALHTLFTFLITRYSKEKTNEILKQVVLISDGMFELVVKYDREDENEVQWINETKELDEEEINYRIILCELITELRAVV